MLVTLVLGMVGAIIFVVNVPKPERGFTEFYLLGLGGKAAGYPTEVRVGEAGKVIAGVINREQRSVVYRIEVSVNGTLISMLEDIALEPRKEWRGVVDFALRNVGERQKVEFLLYRQEDEQAYRQLHLWVTGR